MHKHTKLPPKIRQEVYHRWCRSRASLRSLGRAYHVDKNVIHKILLRGRLGDFTVHDSTNRRYRTIEYGLRRLSKTDVALEKRLLRSQIMRYEKRTPGELVHTDSRGLGNVPRPFGKRYSSPAPKREVLYVAIDDASRFLAADILPDKTSWSGAIFLEQAMLRLPFVTECLYSDNGGEFKGRIDHPVTSLCMRLGVQQKFTKPYHPWTNGKAERVIKTLIYEWLYRNSFKNNEERRRSLYQFVEYYNHERPHQSLNNQTPAERLRSLLSQ